MVGVRWSTAEQTAFLTARLPQFLQSQAERKLLHFYASTSHDFFERWPEREILFPSTGESSTRILTQDEETAVSIAIVKRKRQIKSWFAWHAKPMKGRQTSLTAVNSWFRNQPQHARTRHLNEIEVYSTMFYKEKIKVVVEAQRGVEKLTRSENLALIRKVTADMWASETTEVKELVHQRMEELKASQMESDGKHDEGEGEYKRRPEDFQCSIDSMIPVLAAVGKDVSEKCGWAISIFMGGPVPRAGGAIQVASLHLGKTEHGNSFADSHPTFQEMYMSPFTNFVRKVFPAKLREQRAISGISVTEDAPIMQDVDGLYRMPVETDGITDPSHSADASFQLAGNAGDTMDPSGLPTENGDTTSQASLSPGMANIDLPKPVSAMKSTPAVRESILTAKFATKTIPMPIIAQSTPSLYFSAPETFTQPTVAIPTPAAVPSAAAEPTPHPAPTLVPATESALVALKPHAPSWIIEGYAHLTKQSLGMEFNRCINVWVAFEEVNGYESSERKILPAKGRPDIFNVWLKYGRKYDSPPIIENIPLFEASFTAWWGTLQPLFCGDHTGLKKAGKHGFFTIMLLLCWWGQADGHTATWTVAVRHATTALEEMIGLKRPSPPPDDHRPRKRNCIENYMKVKKPRKSKTRPFGY